MAMADKQEVNNKKNGVNLNRYETDVEGVSLKTLEAGLWWTKNRKILRIILIIFLIAVSAVSWGYTLYGWGNYLFFGMSSDEKMVRELVQSTTTNQALLLQRAPKNLISSATGYVADDGKYDLYVQVTNPNAKWAATFSYCFKNSGTADICGNDFILPGEKKYVFSLAQPLSSGPSGLNYYPGKVSWIKINNHIIPDWNKYWKDHLDITVSNQQLIPAVSNSVSEKIGLNTLSFRVTNNGAYSYWELPLMIVLTNGNAIVFLDRYQVNNFISHESRNIEITWSGEADNVTAISIMPDLNILDQGVYKQPQ
jgi:hypothetical protein